MKYTVSIDQAHSIEWGINQNQAGLFSVIHSLSSWAEEIILENKTYYFASKTMIIKEIPLFYQKPDTVYRALITLSEKELIEYCKFGNKDLVRITEKGKEWNSAELGFKSEYSEMNPNKLGFKSESSSDLNPTYHNTINNTKTNDNIYLEFVKIFNESTGKKIRVLDNKSKKQLSARLKEGFKIEEIIQAAKNCSTDPYHVENKHYLTPEFITRSDKLQKYLNYETHNGKPQSITSQKFQADSKTEFKTDW